MIVFASIVVGAGLVYLLCLGWQALWREDRVFRRKSGRLPHFMEVRAGEIRSRLREYTHLSHLEFVLNLVEPKARTGFLQEEAVVDALYDKIVNRSNWLRESSSILILLALAITFFNLHDKLSAVLSPHAGTFTPDTLRPVLELVGATWPLIFGGFLLYVLSLFEQCLQSKRFENWRHWLETAIFPEIGSSRSTADQLSSALTQFNNTVGQISQAIAPIQGLETALSGFQNGLIENLIPAVEKSLANVSVNLSTQAVEGLRDVTRESTRILRQIQDNQARILTVVIAAEQRSVAIGAAVQEVASQTSRVAAAMASNAERIESNTSAMTGLYQQLGTATATWEQRAATLNDTVGAAAQAIQNNADITRDLTRQTDSLNLFLVELGKQSSALTAEVNSLSSAFAQVQSALAPIVGPLQRTADSVGSFTASALGLQERWQDAMLQMASPSR
jgi:predicted  nucleic acid-binding Zn-ribbon protein